MKFMRLVRVYLWVSPFVFGNNRPNRTADMGENVPQKPFFGFKSDGMRFFQGKTFKRYSVSHFPYKRLYSFLSSDGPVPSKIIMPPRIIFRGYSGKYSFFSRKNCRMKNIQNFNTYKKGYTNFCRQMPPSPENSYVLPQMVFRIFFRK